MVGYMSFEVPSEVQQNALEVLNIAKTSGKIKKGANETTKAIEKGIAKFVIIAGDISPPEIVMHLGPLCDEKGVSYIFVNEKKQLGEVIGIKVGCSSAVIIEAGEGRNALNDLKEKIKQLQEVIILVDKKIVKKGKDEKSKNTTFVEERYQGKVVELIGRTGVRGEATQVRVKVLTGRDKDKIIRRNVKGPVRIDDILMMLETEIEAAPLNGGRGR